MTLEQAVEWLDDFQLIWKVIEDCDQETVYYMYRVGLVLKDNRVVAYRRG